MDDNKDFSVGVEDISDVVKTPNAVQFPTDLFKRVEKEPQLPAEPNMAEKLVDDAVNVGIVHKVRTDEQVQNRILKTVDKVIETNLSVAGNKADKADKEAYFDANKDACTYFGFDEKTTAKTHVKMMKAWSWVFNAIYILTIGFFVVAPIVFFCSKLRVAVKKSWLAIALALFIYALVILSPFVVTWLGRV